MIAHLICSGCSLCGPVLYGHAGCEPGLACTTIDRDSAVVERGVVPPGVAAHLSKQAQATRFGKSFFPHLSLPAFMDGLLRAFAVSAVVSLVAAIASVLRGKRYIHGMGAETGAAETPSFNVTRDTRAAPSRGRAR
jgi:hypothetical protein